MKLLSINAEGYRHIDTVMAFIEREDPDVVCMQESHAYFAELLEKQDYQTAFMPRAEKEQEGIRFIDGALIASKYPFDAQNYYYHTAKDAMPFEYKELVNETKNSHYGFIHASMNVDGVIYDIATTHFTWAPDGSTPTDIQKEDLHTFTKMVATLPPHIMCGDFNIPRHHNSLYEQLTAVYEDTIPEQYTSSLDKELHYLGNNPEKENLFTDFMVDYVFSQNPYKVNNVRLEFGISDHAGVVCEIEK